MDRQAAIKRLIEIADSIDKRAAEETYFVCRLCNHTASLASMNDKRMKVASEAGLQGVDAVTVNDVVGCPACGGDMSYVPTEYSEHYYIEAADVVPEETGEVGEAEVVEEKKPVPTDEAPKPSADDDLDLTDDDEDLNLDYEDDDGDTQDPDSEGPSEAPAEEPPAESEDVSETVTETEVEPEEKKPPKKKKKDKPDDGKPHLPKDKVPKFEFPKRAGDESFMQIVSKYL